MIFEYRENKPAITKFENKTQRQLYREYDRLRLVEDKKSSKPQERSAETSDSYTKSYDRDANTIEKASQGVDQDAYQNDQIRANSEDSERP